MCFRYCDNAIMRYCDVLSDTAICISLLLLCVSDYRDPILRYGISAAELGLPAVVFSPVDVTCEFCFSASLASHVAVASQHLQEITACPLSWWPSLLPLLCLQVRLFFSLCYLMCFLLPAVPAPAAAPVAPPPAPPALPLNGICPSFRFVIHSLPVFASSHALCFSSNCREAEREQGGGR